MNQRLRVLSGPHKGCSFDLLEPGIKNIGRQQQYSEICIPDPLLSRVHCQVEVDGNQVILVDLDSDQGTFVNGERIKKRQLMHGDVIRLGDTKLCYQAIEGPDPDNGAPEKTPAPVSTRPPPEPDVPASAPASPAGPSGVAIQSLSEMPGTALAHYEIGSLLGKGHCGSVFRARDLKVDRLVALKVLQPDFPKNDEEMKRFVRAMKIGGTVRHPHLVTIFAAGRTGTHCWIAQEFVEGESLDQTILRLAATGTHDWQLAFRGAVHLGRALYCAHQHHLVHRNLTPRNILFRTTDNLLKLADLVLAHALTGSLLRQVCLRGKVQNELPYLAPEQTLGAPSFDSRSDIYSLGVVVYALLAGTPPFLGKTTGETIAQIRQEDPTAPRFFQSSIPPVFEDIMLKMLAKRPKERYQNAAELLADLGRVAPDAA